MSDNIAPQRQTNPDNIEELIRQQVQFQLQIQQMVRQQLEQYSPSFPAITELQLEVAEIKRILEAMATVDNPRTLSDDCTTSGNRSHPASTQPRSATQRQSDSSRSEQSQPATASTQPEPAIQRQPEPLIDERRQLSDNRDAISDSDNCPGQPKPAAASIQVQPQSTSEQLPKRDRTELSDSPPDIALQQSDSPSRDRHLTATEDRSEPATALQLVSQQSDKPAPGYRVGQSTIPKDFVEPGQEPQLPSGNRIVEISTADDLLAEIRWCLNNGGDFVFLFDRGKSGNGTPRRTYYLRHSEWYWEGMRPVKTALVKELIDRRAIWTNDPAKGPGSGCRRFYPTAASTLAQESLPPSATPDLERSPDPAPEFPEWMTAKQAFQALGGDPGDRNSSVSSIDGLKQIKFSTFKSKTSSELKPFGLELSQDRKRRRQPCYRFL